MTRGSASKYLVLLKLQQSKSSRLYKLSWLAGTETKMAADEHMADPGVAHDVHDDVDGHGNGNGTRLIGADGTSTTATPIDSADGTAHDKQRPRP